MRKETAQHDGHQEQRQRVDVSRIDDVLDELLAQYSVRFPQFKIVIVGRSDDVGAGGSKNSHP